MVRSIRRSPSADPSSPDHLALGVSVNDCESSVVQVALPALLGLLAPVVPSPRLRMPRLIHQVWIGRGGAPLPAAMRAWAASWARLHPAWGVRLWTAAAVRALVAEEYPWLLEAYDGFDVTVKRADLARYLVLHRYGGVAVDLDLEALRPVDDLLYEGAGARRARHAVQIAEHDVQRGYLSIGFMASVPGHPLWWHLAREARRLWAEDPGLYVVRATGNGLLTSLARHGSFRGDVAAVPRGKIFPLPYTHKRTRAARACRADAAWCARRFPAAYTVHHAAHSWAAEDAHREPAELYQAVAARVDAQQ